MHRTISSEHNHPHSSGYTSTVDGARQDSTRHEEPRKETPNRPAETSDYRRQPEAGVSRNEQPGYTQPAEQRNDIRRTSETRQPDLSSSHAPDSFSKNSPAPETYAPKIEVATVQSVSGNHYVVPDSKRERFEELKTIMESPGKAPAEIRNELKGFEQYDAKKYESVGSAVPAQQPAQGSVPKVDFSSKPLENMTVTGKTNTATEVQRTITNERYNPAPTSGGSSTDSARQDALRQQPKREEPVAQPKTDPSKIVILTVDGKGVAAGMMIRSFLRNSMLTPFNLADDLSG